MRKMLRVVLVAAVVLHASVEVALAQAQFNLRFASYAPEGDVFDRSAHRFAEEAARLTGDRVKVTVFRSNSLGSNREALEMAKVGSVDFVIAGSTHVSRYAPVLISVSFPYMWKDAETMFRLLDGDVGKRLQELVGKQGLQILGWWENGFRHVSNSKRPIVKADDIRGLKLRTLPSPVHVAFFRKLGAIPTPMDWAEVMPALQQGVIDGQENPPAVMYPYRVFEFQKFYSLTAHSNDPTMFVMSAATMAKLPKDVPGRGPEGGPRGHRVRAEDRRRLQPGHHGQAQPGHQDQPRARGDPGAVPQDGADRLPGSLRRPRGRRQSHRRRDREGLQLTGGRPGADALETCGS